MKHRKLTFCLTMGASPQNALAGSLASLVSLLVLIASCSEVRVPAPPASDNPLLSGTAPAPQGTLLPGAPAQVVPAAPAWVEAVRLERWADAVPLLDALPEAERARAEIRYVRARAAIGTGDGARANELLAGLDALLPRLAADIARWRAEAQWLAGPYAEAGAYFARSTNARDLVRASQAYEKAGDAVSALRCAEQAVAAAQRAKSARDEAHARLHRARVKQARGAGAAAEADLRWVAARVPGTLDGKAAAQMLERENRAPAPKDPGPAAPRAPRAAKPPARAPRAPARAEALHAKASTLFKARSYEAAAKAYRAAAAAKGPREAEALYQAARERAHRDGEAITAYREVVTRFRRSTYAERAAYFGARLLLQNGRFKEADQAFARYLGANPRGEHRDDAAYERALAMLSSGSAEGAGKIFAALARKARKDEAARLRQLEGLASLRAGDRDGAVATWTSIARAQPLTWASIAARARLAALGAPLPPLIEPVQVVPVAASGSLDVRLPPTPALLASVGLDGDAERYLLASERELSAPFSGREGEALCGLYGLLSRAKRRYRVGVAAVDAALLFRAPSPAERWAWNCVYPQPFASGVRALEDHHGLPKGLVHALMRQESAFDPAIVSPASAVGLMQLMPATAKQAASELSMPFDPAHLTSPDVNLRLGAFYIAKLLKMFQGNVVLAAAAYNAGPRAVSHWIEAGADDDLDLWVARIPYDETRNYVARVAQNLARYQWLGGGDAAVASIALAMPRGVRAPADAY